MRIWGVTISLPPSVPALALSGNLCCRWLLAGPTILKNKLVVEDRLTKPLLDGILVVDYHSLSTCAPESKTNAV